MGVFNWSASGNANTFVWNFAQALDAEPGWSILLAPSSASTSNAAAIGGNAGASSFTYVLQNSHATNPFVLILYVATSSTSSFGVGLAEAFDVDTKLFTNVAYGNSVPASVAGDDSFNGSTPIAFNTGFTTWSSVGSTVSQGVTTDNILFLNGSFAPYAFGRFTSAVHPSTADTRPLIAISGLSSARFTRLPKHSTMSVPVASWAPGSAAAGIGPWISGDLTAAVDPFNTANPTGYNFSPVAIRHETGVGGELRGTLPDLLWCAAGAAGEEVSLPGVGVYRKSLASSLWIKVGSA